MKRSEMKQLIIDGFLKYKKVNVDILWEDNNTINVYLEHFYTADRVFNHLMTIYEDKCSVYNSGPDEFVYTIVTPPTEANILFNEKNLANYIKNQIHFYK